MASPTIQTLRDDPDFKGLPDLEKLKVLDHIDADFRGLPQGEKVKVLGAIGGGIATPQPQEATPPPSVEGSSPWEVGQVPTVREVVGAASPVYRPVLETGGLLGGGVLGAPTGPVGGVAGAGLGYGIGKGVADRLDEYAGVKARKSTAINLLTAAKDVGTGATMEMGGQAAGKAIGKGLEFAGRFGKQAIGKMTGAGTGAADEAVKGSEAFTSAMRGKTSPEEIVANAKEALSVIKDKRAAAYQVQLQGIQGGKEIDITPIQMKMADLMKRFGVRVEVDGSLNLSRTSLGKAGNKDVAEVVDTVRGWGTQKGDKTAVGLDTLKRQLDDFYSDSSNARGFVAALRNEVKGTIVKNVPEYATMTKNYSEATSLIKDMEAGLMLRKQGMTGRVVADQTLRRLTSAMQDNFILRRELLEVLGTQGGKDLSGQVGGYAMSQYLPRGLAGVPAGMAGMAAMLQYINPKFVPLIAASSPRLAGEFLRMLGKGAAAAPGASMAVGRAAAYATVPPARDLLGR
jgi:hypothetical protein